MAQNAIIPILNTIKIMLRNIELALIIVCTIGVWHYFCVFYPRFVTIDEHYSRIQNLGIDYWGIIVGFLALIVTLLVGWNIYNTIKAKEELAGYRKGLPKELDNAKKSLASKYDNVIAEIQNRLLGFEKCCIERGEEIEDVKSLISNEILKVKADMLLANGLYAMEKALKAEQNLEKLIFSEAYRQLLDSLYIQLQLNLDVNSFKYICEKMEECLCGLENAKVKFSEITYKECIKTIDKILSEFDLTDRQRNKINALKTTTEDISYKSFEQSIYDYAISVINRANKDSENISRKAETADNSHQNNPQDKS